MKVWSKVLICIALSFSFAFMCIGYAALSDDFEISGAVIVEQPDYNEVIMTDVSLFASSSGASSTQSRVTPTNLNSSIVFSSADDYVTYKITVKNYSKNIKYAYSGIEYINAEGYDNALYKNGLSVTLTAYENSSEPFPEGYAIAPEQEIGFYATYRITDASLVGSQINTFLNYKFGVHIDSAGNAVIDNALGRFEEILNTSADIERLREQMASKNHDYLGNVAGNDEADDSALINELFTTDEGLNQLRLTATNGEEKEVTCIIKEESLTINGENTPTMTIYMTADEITGQTGFGSSSSVSIDVYAAAYAQINGIWFPLGDMYLGNAKTANYNGSWFSECNSFNTDTWESTAQTYKVLDNYSYTIQSGSSIAAVLSSVAPADAWDVFLELEAKLHAIDLGNYTLNAALEEEIIAIKNYADMLIEKGRTETLLAELVPMMKDMSRVLKLFE